MAGKGNRRRSRPTERSRAKQVVTVRLPPDVLARAKAAAAADDRTLSYYLAKVITQALER